MESETHLNFVTGHSCIKPRILSVFENVLEFVDLSDDLQERKESQIRTILVFFGDFLSFLEEFVFVPKLPHQQKGISNVLVC